MRTFKRFFILFLAMSFMFDANNVVFAGTKKSVRKAGLKRVAGAGSKRISRGGKASRLGKTGGGVNATLPTSGSVSSVSDDYKSSTASAKSVECRSAYTQCMDAQIAGYVSKYAYLAQDPAVESIQETTDPLRCIYYDKSYNISEDVPDLNELYFAYNYYCDQVKDGNEANLSKCTYNKNKGSLFATKNSYAFYKTAYDRLKADELVILHFNETSLYKNKYRQLLGEEKANALPKVTVSDVKDMFKSLGLDATSSMVCEEKNKTKICTYGDGTVCTTASTGTTTCQKNGAVVESENLELFSISVAPEELAGSLNPAGVFQKAHQICMGYVAPTTKDTGLAQKELGQVSEYVRAVKRCTNYEELADSFMRYYQNGRWEGCPVGYKFDTSSGMCTKKGADEVYIEESDTGFLSARNSCLSYETALSGSRLRAYAKFQDQMTNYLNENLAQLIKKEAKNEGIMTEAFTDLAKAQTDRELLDRKVELAKLEVQTEMDRKQAEFERDQANIKREIADTQKEINQIQIDVERANLENEKAKQDMEQERHKAALEAAEAAEKRIKDWYDQKKKSAENAANVKAESALTKTTKFNGKNSASYSSGSGTWNLGRGCYAITMNGAGGGGGDSCVTLNGGWGNKGGYGAKGTMNICIKSGSLNVSYSVGSAGKGRGSKTDGTSGGDTYITLSSSGAIIEKGATLGATYKAKGGAGGRACINKNVSATREDGAGCEGGSEISCTAGGGAGGGDVHMLTAGDDGDNGSISISTSSNYADETASQNVSDGDDPEVALKLRDDYLSKISSAKTKSEAEKIVDDFLAVANEKKLSSEIIELIKGQLTTKITTLNLKDDAGAGSETGGESAK